MTRTLRLPALLTLAALTLVLATGCRSGADANPILRLSAQEALAEGKRLLAEDKHARARDHLTHAYEVEPNSLAGREALLLTADSFYLQGGRTNLVQAESRYRDFLNRFPTSDRAAYAQFQIANSLAARMGRPDRDLAATRDALAAYQDLIRLYPTSEYAAQAREKSRLVEANLARHELEVGDFYMRYRLPKAAADRYAYLIERHPLYEGREEVLYKLGVAYVESGQGAEAQEAFDRLAEEYPKSSFLARLPAIPPPAEDDTADDSATPAADSATEADTATETDGEADGEATGGVAE